MPEERLPIRDQPCDGWDARILRSSTAACQRARRRRRRSPGAYGALMSRHAAQLAATAQKNPAGVEVLHSGVWRPASVLSWRTDDGVCRVLVRLGAEGGGQTIWTDTRSLRAPQLADDHETQRMSAVGRAGCPPPRAPQRSAHEEVGADGGPATMRLPLSIAVPPSRGGLGDVRSTW